MNQIQKSKFKSQNSKPQTMADLLDSHKSSFVSIKKGDNVPGTITKLTSSEILVDVGAKTEAVVLEKDKNILHSLLSSLKVGDKVSVYILSPESDFGYPVVSLRRFIDEKIWDKATDLVKKKEILDITIDEETRGGYVASFDGISGFMPNSHMVSQDSDLVGKTVKATIYEVNKESRKIIFSQKTTLTRHDFEEASRNIKTKDKVSAKIINVAPFGIFVSLPSATSTPLEGFIHQSEASWEGPDLSGFKQGNTLEAQVIGLDFENKRVNLSIKRLTQDPFAAVMEKFVPDKKVTGTITKISGGGITLDLSDGVEGVIKKDKVPPNSKYEVGQEISATVVDVDTNRHRVTLVPVLLEKPIGYR